MSYNGSPKPKDEQGEEFSGRFIRTTRELCSECEEGMYEIRGFEQEQIIEGVISFSEQTYKVCPTCGDKIESKQNKGGSNAGNKKSDRFNKKTRRDYRGSAREGGRRFARDF